MNVSDRYLIPAWPAPATVGSCVTRRSCGGPGREPFSCFNLGWNSGDDRGAVATNRALLLKDWGWPCQPQWLKQVHGVGVVPAQGDGAEREGDAVWTHQVGLPCAVLTADCLPAIFTNRAGTCVGVAHAGWKGLVAGVLQATIAAMGEPSSDLMVWLGPAISQQHFEVGPEVRNQFIADDAGSSKAFVPGAGDRWYGDLYQLARQRLTRSGVHHIYGGGLCTFTDQVSWFSYRREGVRSGRLATIVWLNAVS